MRGIYFPGTGIEFPSVPESFSVFGFEVKLYGLVIFLGYVLALVISLHEAKRTGQDPEDYWDFLMAMIVPSILGARIYYVLFNLKEYTGTGKSAGKVFLDMLNIRDGGLAIYGGLIAGTITAVVLTGIKKISLPLLADTVTMGILVGQILGRWGNFFNREAFGSMTKGVTRMAIPVEYYTDTDSLGYMTRNGIITDDMLKNTETVRGVECITVHPTFLYEGLWNLALLAFLFFYRKKKKFDGELAMLYVAGYGIGRVIVESFRTDSLMIGPLKVSQVVGVCCFLLGTGVIIMNRMKIRHGKVLPVHTGVEHNEEAKKAEKTEASEKTDAFEEADASEKTDAFEKAEKPGNIRREKPEEERDEAAGNKEKS